MFMADALRPGIAWGGASKALISQKSINNESNHDNISLGHGVQS